MGKVKDIILENEELKETAKMYQEYLSYLREWYSKHSDLKYENMEPLDFEAFCYARPEEL
jgi:hypothetical protein